MTNYIIEPEKKIPVIAEADLCVIGGSCTGVFAAVRAARLGLKVILIEKQNMLGGTAVSGLVNYWHSLHDVDGKDQIISGLTEETLLLLEKRGSLLKSDNPTMAYNFSPWELTLILDSYIKENKISLLLHTVYSSVVTDGEKIHSVIVENSDGRGAIKAKFFIDASGSGRVAKDLGISSYRHEYIQPPTSCFHLSGSTDGIDINELYRHHAKDFGLADDWGWYAPVAGLDRITLRADNHVFSFDTDNASELTKAEMEGRRLADAFTNLLRQHGNPKENYAISSLCSQIGIRETVHYETQFKADTMSLLTGKKFDAPILNGSYRVDIHHSYNGSITFKYLNGIEETFYGKGTDQKIRNWRTDAGLDENYAKYYQLPFESLICKSRPNFIAAGRMINADPGAFGALRVMVNLNQIGEAAGVAAYVCINENSTVDHIDAKSVTRLLIKGGSAL